MSVLNKPYELSVWFDEWNSNSNKFDEKRICTIGAHDMVSQSRALNPKLVQNVNGSNTFSFMIYYRYKDNITGEEVENPFAQYLTNERKLKLKYDDQWYDLIIKSIKVDTTKYTYEITAIDQYINELSKNGFNKTFDAELQNNVGSIQTLAQRTLEETDWVVPNVGSSGSEFVPDMAKEALVKISLTSTPSGSIYQIIENDGSAPTLELVSGSLPSTTIYAFYSCCAEKAKRFQFYCFSDSTSILIDDERIIKNKNCQYYIDNIIYMNDSTYGIGKPTNSSIIEISAQYRGARYVFSSDMQYHPIIKQYVTEYTKDNTSYLGYSTTKYVAPTAIQNYITNPNSFKSTDGWRVGRLTGSLSFASALQNVAINNETHATLMDDIKNHNFESTNQYISQLKYSHQYWSSDLQCYPILVNSGFYDNRIKIDNLVNTKQYIIEIKASRYTNLTIKLGRYIKDTSDINQYTIVGHPYFTVDGSTFSDIPNGTGKYAIVTIENSDFTPKEYKNQYDGHVYVVIEDQTTDSSIGQTTLLIEDFQIFEYIPSNTLGIPYIRPNDQLLEAKTITTYHLYNKDQLNYADPTTSLDEFKPAYEGTDTIESQGYVTTLSCEKRRAITAKESNFFNIIQTLCENFECWAQFDIGHDANGYITEKQLLFKNFVGQENYAGFRYGVNLKSISRTDDSKQIVTKLIVKQNSNEFGKNGFCTITRAPSNVSKENYLYNFDYYISQGLLDPQTWNDAWYKSDGFEQRLHNVNIELEKINDDLGHQEVILAEAQQQKTLYANGRQSAEDKLEEAANKFRQMFAGWEWNNFILNDKILYGYKQSGAPDAPTQSYDSYNDPTVLLWHHERVTTGTYVDNYFSYSNGNGAAGTYQNPILIDATKPQKNPDNFIDSAYLEANIGVLQSCIEQYQAEKDYASKLVSITTYVEQLENDLKNAKASQQGKISQKDEILTQFYTQFSRFIQEGTWNSEEYYDDEKYYLDAQSTLYNSCVPKVSYSMSVLELSQLTGYEAFSFRLGDRTFVEDPEFFGYDNTGAPVREQVVLTEITYNLDQPEKNTIKIQNYKTQFQDLFKKITATVQSVQYSTGAYQKAADLANATNQQKAQYLQGALSDASMILENLAEQTVRLDSEGLTIVDGIETNKALRAVAGGILLTEDGGNTWKTGVTAQGVSASVLTSGILNTGEVNIMYGKEPTFRWDAFGLTAYDYTATNGTNITSVDTSSGVRFDRLGLYGFTGAPGDWHPSKVAAWTINTTQHTISPTSDNTYVRAHSIFELTRRGLYLNLGKGDNRYYHYYQYNSSSPSDPPNGYYSFSSPSYRTHITHAELGKIWDVVYNNWTSTGVPYYSSTASSYGTFSKVFVAGRGDTVSESFALFDDGVIKAKKIYVEDGIGFNDGSGLVHAVYHKYFSDGPQKPTDGTPYSAFPDNEDHIQNGWHKIRSVDDYYTSVSYDNGNHWDYPTGVLGEVWYLTLPRGNSLSQSSDGGWPTWNVIEKNAFQVTAHKRENGTEGNQSVYWQLTTTNNSSSAISVDCGTTSADTIYISTTSINGVWCWSYKVGSTGSITTASTLHVTTSPLVVGAYLDSNRDNGFASENIVCIIKGAPGEPGQNGDSALIQTIYQVNNSASAPSTPTNWVTTSATSSWSSSEWYCSTSSGIYPTPSSIQPYLWCAEQTCTQHNNSYTNIKTSDPILEEAYLNNSALNTTHEGRRRYATMLRLTDGLTNQGIYYNQGSGVSDNKLYINAEYINTGAITVSNGSNTVFSADISAQAVSVAGFRISTVATANSDSSDLQKHASALYIPQDWGTNVTQLSHSSGTGTSSDGYVPNGIYLGTYGVGFTTTNNSGGRAYVNINGENSQSWRLIIGPNFGVLGNGTLHATGANISGTINASGGTIGGWHIMSDRLFALNGSDQTTYVGLCTSVNEAYRIWAGNITASVAPFSVKADGTLKASAGYIGNWKINDGDLVGTDVDNNYEIKLMPAADGVTTNDAPIGPLSSLVMRFGKQNTALLGITRNGEFYANRVHLSGELATNKIDTINSTTSSTTITATHKDIIGSGQRHKMVVELTATTQIIISSAITVYYKYFEDEEAQTGYFTVPAGTVISSTNPYVKDLTGYHVDFSWGSGGIRNTNSGNYSLSCTYERTGTTKEILIGGSLIATSTAYNIGKNSAKWGTIYAVTGTINTSDRRLKQDITSFPLQYNQFFDKIQPVIYRFIDNTSNRLHSGFIAQNILDALTQANLTPLDFAGYCYDKADDGTESYGLRYSEFIALNTWQIQLLKPRISDLEQKCLDLESRIKELEVQLNKTN